MTIHNVHPGQEIPALNRGDVLMLYEGYHRGSIPLPEPGVAIEGEPGTILTAATTGTLTWQQEGPFYWSTNLGFQPAVLMVNGQQVLQCHPSHMRQGTRKTFGRSGIDLMESGPSLILGKRDGVDWNGEGDIWEVLYGLWGYMDGRVYLRLNQGDPNDLPIEAAPQNTALILPGDCQVSGIEFRCFATTALLESSGNHLDGLTIRGGNQRIIIRGGEDNYLTNSHVTMALYGKIPGAWQGGSAQGEILYRAAKYMASGASSSADVSILLDRPGGGNVIEHNLIDHGILGIQQRSKGQGANRIAHNEIEYNNSIGFAVVHLNDGTEVYNNDFRNNNLAIRLQATDERGKSWRGYFYSNRMENPPRLGGAVFVHSFGGAPVDTIEYNYYHNTMVGGGAGLEMRNGRLQGVIANNTWNREPGPAEPIDGNLPGMQPMPRLTGRIEGRYPDPGIGEGDEPRGGDKMDGTVEFKGEYRNTEGEGQIHVEIKIAGRADPLGTQDYEVVAGGTTVIDVGFPVQNLSPGDVMICRVEDPQRDYALIALAKEEVTMPPLAGTVTGSFNFTPDASESF